MSCPHVCSIVPNLVLQKVASSPSASAHSRACAARSLLHSHRLHANRRALLGVRSATIIPTQIYDAIIDNEAVSDEAKEHARTSRANTEQLQRDRQQGAILMSADQRSPKRLRRVLYDCEHTDEVPGQRVLREGQNTSHVDSCGQVREDSPASTNEPMTLY